MDFVTYIYNFSTHSDNPFLISKTIGNSMKKEYLETQKATIDLGKIEKEQGM
jgi:hypothetical protein